MKKRLTALLCVVALLLGLTPQTAFAAGGLEGVDYSRIGGTGHRVTLTLGELVFEGELSRGSILSDSEKDKIIKQTMNDLGITSGMLLNAKTMLDAAHKLQGFGMEDVKKAVMKLAGVDNYVDLYQLVMGTGQKTPAQIAYDIAKGQVKDEAQKTVGEVLEQGGKIALKGAGKYAFKLLFLLPEMIEIGVDSLTKYEKNKEVLAVALERQMLLDSFYDTVNQRITEASGDRGAWEIRFDKSQNYRTYNCTFWGISGVMMSAELSGVLEQVSEIDGAAGQYRGTLWLDLAGVDMASFDSRFRTEHNFVFKAGIDGWQRDPGFVGYEDIPNQATVLERQVQGEISVMVTGGKGTQISEVSGSLTSGGDETQFVFDHTINGTAKVTSYDKRTYTTHITSSSVESVDRSYKSVSISTGPYIGTRTTINWDKNDTGIPADPGTVWKPLESKPSITVYFGN